MSNSQKQAIAKVFNITGQWLNRAMLAAILWMMSEMYDDFKTEFKDVKKDVNDLKQDTRANSVAIDFLKDQIKAKR
jgi:hypothetical protein